ncbi:MAG: transporter [Actinobacteria bacterium HGW-Actinobacteria-9]|jgi:energy-coupling factor transport system permease protein|nr:MAG: transporter [Actinobacteria bacterium HGW-Actinobacteria-9]
MKASMPFGQYVPVDSPVHRLEARAKMGIVAAFTTLLFATGGFAGLAIAAGFTAVGIAVSRVPVRLALRGLKAISFLLVFTLAAHALRWNPATVTLFRIGPLGVDGPGLLTGAYFASRVVLLVAGTSLLTLTTSPVELTDGLERLMRPLGRIGIPVGELAMMLTIALRFIPTTAEEAEKIVMAQAARGAKFDSGGPVRRARAYVPVLVPLFVGLFRRADELATAMESRCYHGGPHRTRLRISELTATDWNAMVLIGGTMVALGIWL